MHSASWHGNRMGTVTVRGNTLRALGIILFAARRAAARSRIRTARLLSRYLHLAHIAGSLHSTLLFETLLMLAGVPESVLAPPHCEVVQKTYEVLRYLLFDVKVCPNKGTCRPVYGGEDVSLVHLQRPIEVALCITDAGRALSMLLAAGAHPGLALQLRGVSTPWRRWHTTARRMKPAWLALVRALQPPS